MSMGRYLCQLCWSIVHYGERHPCFFYKKDEEVYTVPPPMESEGMERRPEETKGSLPGNLNQNNQNICIAAQTNHDEGCKERNSLVIENDERISLVPSSGRNRRRSSMFPPFRNRDSECASEPEDGEKRSKAQRKRKSASAEATQRVDSSRIGEASCSSATHGREENVAGPSGIRTQSLGSENERALVCDICGRGFAGIGHLNRHRRTQACEKRFACSMCDKAFSKKFDLERHIRTHTGEKPFPCNICGERFTLKHHLDAHIRAHTGEKPFECDICGERFAHKGNLQVHVRTHTGEKPFKCKWCGREFSKSSNCKSHLKQVHGEE